LGAGFHCVRESFVVHIVATKDVCYEYSMKFGLFELLGQIDPVLDGIEVRGSIVGVLPEAGGLVAGA
jgi:hypothetical protein